ncbi:MAG: RNase adapter RapZ [Candidatus Wallbacteria bacterium]|nr:RNase adapter RapZ [Candidatus Wallbacteria bacterium]MBI4868332.1 RNase adapter RapZ [Candidatus Wallbacteria bacterium]
MDHQSFYILTGMSGAGKSLASRVLEDQGFYCVDNLPVKLVRQFVELAINSQKNLSQVAMVCDIRSGEEFQPLFSELDELEQKGIKHHIVFLEAATDSLIRRFSETRRKHPVKGPSLRDSIETERKLLADLRGHADLILDTSGLTGTELKNEILRIIDRKLTAQGLNIVLESFGFKYGIPIEADLLFDVRFLPNPHYVSHLSPLTGTTAEVQEYVFSSPASHEFLSRLQEFLDFLLPQFALEGKSHLTIAIGCTGGKHRSVTMVEKLDEYLAARQYNVLKMHRDSMRG